MAKCCLCDKSKSLTDDAEVLQLLCNLSNATNHLKEGLEASLKILGLPERQIDKVCSEVYKGSFSSLNKSLKTNKRQ